MLCLQNPSQNGCSREQNMKSETETLRLAILRTAETTYEPLKMINQKSQQSNTSNNSKAKFKR